MFSEPSTRWFLLFAYSCVPCCPLRLSDVPIVQHVLGISIYCDVGDGRCSD